jgi:hypothetical protein|tara:strand:+ start:770 stop:1195 length:426 start_codon:yes stop_codon:yes gene_type:complete
MINKEKLYKELEDILNLSIDPGLFPYQKGNSIRIGSFVVRWNKNGYYKLYNIKENKLIQETFCKTSAVAMAKTLAKGQDSSKSILTLDKDIQKWYNDCIFYKHSMLTTDDNFRRDIISTRYEIARYKTVDAKRKLDKYIYA